MIGALPSNKWRFAHEAFTKKGSINGTGLLDGLTGVALAYYVMGKQQADRSFSDNGQYLLEWVFENGTSIADLSFATGMTGVGWCVEWLVQNGLLEDTNTDEVLDPVDGLLYQAVAFKKDENISLLTGLLGKIAYFARREKSSNPGTHRYKRIGHRECIILLTDDLNEWLTPGSSPIPLSGCSPAAEHAGRAIGPIELGSVLTVVSSVMEIKVNSPTLDTILHNSIKRADGILTADKAAEDDDRLNLLYLAVCYIICGKNYKFKHWIEKGLDYAGQLLPLIEAEEIQNVDGKFKKLAVYSLLNIHSPDRRYRETIQQLLAELSSCDLGYTLQNGRATLALAEICLEEPELISNWHEVFFVQ